MKRPVRINFQASEKEALFFRRLSEITGMSLSEILRRSVVHFAKAHLACNHQDIVEAIKIFFGKAVSCGHRKIR